MKKGTIHKIHTITITKFERMYFMDGSKVNNFQMAKVQPQGVAWLFLGFFSQIQLGIVYKSDAYKKSVWPVLIIWRVQFRLYLKSLNMFMFKVFN